MWVTVTDGVEAQAATAVGADAVVAQGAEAGAHRGSFVDGDGDPLPLLDLLAVVRRECAGPRDRCRGRIDDGRGHRRRAARREPPLRNSALRSCCVLRRKQVPCTVTLCSRIARLCSPLPFTGRRARGLVNVCTEQFNAAVPSAYPQIHYITAPLAPRTAALMVWPHLVNLWAGTRHALARSLARREARRDARRRVGPDSDHDATSKASR